MIQWTKCRFSGNKTDNINKTSNRLQLCPESTNNKPVAIQLTRMHRNILKACSVQLGLSSCPLLVEDLNLPIFQALLGISPRGHWVLLPPRIQAEHQAISKAIICWRNCEIKPRRWQARVRGGPAEDSQLWIKLSSRNASQPKNKFRISFLRQWRTRLESPLSIMCLLDNIW